MHRPLLLCALLVLAGCAEPAARSSGTDAPRPDPFEKVGEPWMVWLEGCGHCHAGQALAGIVVTRDSRALWWSYEPGVVPKEPNATLELPPGAAHLRSALAAVQAHVDPAYEDGGLSWVVREAFVVDLGGWSDLRRDLAENETAARLQGESEPPGCHDCPRHGVVLWPDPPAQVVDGYEREGWSALSRLLGEVATGLGPHQEAS